MLVKIEYKNRNMEFIGTEIFEFDTYCQKLSQDTISILTYIEAFLETQDFACDEMYRKLRHRVFDISGSIKRLPDNLLEEEKPIKATKNGILSFFKGD